MITSLEIKTRRIQLWNHHHLVITTAESSRDLQSPTSEIGQIIDSLTDNNRRHNQKYIWEFTWIYNRKHENVAVLNPEIIQFNDNKIIHSQLNSQECISIINDVMYYQILYIRTVYKDIWQKDIFTNKYTETKIKYKSGWKNIWRLKKNITSPVQMKYTL